MADKATARAVAVTPAVREAAEAFVEALVAHGVQYLFINPGTDTVPIQEAVAKRQSHGEPVPQVVLCPFEGVALAAAHGVYAVTGRPQAVLVHVDVGTQNLGAMLHNAQRGRAAVLVCAGRAPYAEDPAVRGSRDAYIHWLQEQLDQHGIVRNYVKWDYEVRRPDQIGQAVARGLQIAASDPPGPVYLTLPREVLMEPTAAANPDPGRHQPVRAGAGDPESLDLAARWLIEAQRPLVLTAATGRSTAGWNGLLRLAETLALPVVEWRTRANFPSDHPLHQGYNYGLESGLEEADCVLILDHDVPFLPSQHSLRPDARVIVVDVDPVKERIPLWSFPVDLPIRADTGRALPRLADLVADRLTARVRQRVERRRNRLAERHGKMRQRWAETAAAQAQSRPITVAWLGACIQQLRQEHPDLIIVDEAVTSQLELFCQIQTPRPHSWFQSGGSGLGWGLGGAIGVKLAAPQQPVMALVGDGSFFFGVPEAAFWVAQTAGAPILAVVCNNGGYNATKQPLRRAYSDGYAVRTGYYPAVQLTPGLNVVRLAEAVGAYGQRVEDPGDLLDALRRGVERVQAGQSAVIDVALGQV